MFQSKLPSLNMFLKSLCCVLCLRQKWERGVAFWSEVDVRAPVCSIIRGLPVPLSCDSESEPDKGGKLVLAAW